MSTTFGRRGVSKCHWLQMAREEDLTAFIPPIPPSHYFKTSTISKVFDKMKLFLYTCPLLLVFAQAANLRSKESRQLGEVYHTLTTADLGTF